MKVLSDWYTGTPPMPGMWLVRQREFADVDAGKMLMWNGHEFVTIIGSRPILIGAVEWRGLAFDPARLLLAHTTQGMTQQYVRASNPVRPA